VRFRGATALAVVGAALALGAGQGSAAGLDWAQCGKRLQCATLQVPIDHASPTGAQLGLALARLPATDSSRRIGSLVVNPGGPGASGIEFVRQGAAVFPAALRARFDIVGFDPRGVGKSSPIRCRTDPELDLEEELDPTPDTGAERQALADAARRVAAECGERAAALLPYVSTDAGARDLDLIRAALGDEKLTYLGFSYGTMLGATYAALFPDRVRALALDGAVDPTLWTGDPVALLRGQASGFQAAWQSFLADCRGHRARCKLAQDGDPARVVARLLRRLDRHPLPIFGDADRHITEGFVTTAIVSALYSHEAWPVLAEALHQLWARRNGVLVVFLADLFTGRHVDGTHSNLQDAYDAVTCADWALPADPSAYLGLGAALRRIAPLFGAAIGLEPLVCSYWPARPASRVTGPFTAAGAPPILVVGTTGDPATPYPWARALVRALGPPAVLLTWRGRSHTAYGESRCAAAAVDGYLIDLEPPRPGTVCRD
jgi:pimeloyl-ACP methyl ester carboxylesterase